VKATPRLTAIYGRKMRHLLDSILTLPFFQIKLKKNPNVKSKRFFLKKTLG
jgi:hypothetical protein